MLTIVLSSASNKKTQKKLIINSTSMDKAAKFDKIKNIDKKDNEQVGQEATNTNDAKKCKAQFMENYGVKFYIPSLYVIDAKILSLKEGFILQAVKYVMPEESYERNLKIITHKVDSPEPIFNTYQELYQPYIGNVVIRILKRKCESGIQKFEEEFLIEKADSAMIKVTTNEDAKYVAIYYTRNSQSHDHDHNHETSQQFIEVYKIDEEEQRNPRLLIEKMNQRKWHCYYSSQEAAQENGHHDHHKEAKKTDIGFVKDMIFDNEMKYLIGYGNTSFFTLDLIGQDSQDLLKIYDVNSNEFEGILHMQYTSSTDKNPFPQCWLVCKVQDQNQICVFEYLFDQNKQPKHLKSESQLQQSQSQSIKDHQTTLNLYDQKEENDRIRINYVNKITSELIIRLSKDSKRLIFTDCLEKFIIDISKENKPLFNGISNEIDLKKKPELKSRVIIQVEDLVVRHIYEDPDSEGFYLVCSQKYDDEIQVVHTDPHIGIFSKMTLEREVEPGTIKIFDLVIDFGIKHVPTPVEACTQSKQICKDAPNISKDYELSLIGMKDDEFTLDYASWTIIVGDGKLTTFRGLCENVMSSSLMENVKKIPYTYSVVNAFSINWPYVAYSGLNNELVILNAFQQDEIHRVELSTARQSEINILGTYITDTRDLFILVHCISEHIYKLYYLDLDACNEREQDDDDEEDLVVDEGPPQPASDGYEFAEGGSLTYSNQEPTNKNQLTKNQIRSNNYQIGSEQSYDQNSNITKSRKRRNNKKTNPYDVSKCILKYTDQDVEKQPFKQLLVRGSSQKDKINFNENLMVFFLHGNTLFNWTSKPHAEQTLDMVQKITSKSLYPKNDSCFFFRQDLTTQEEKKEQRTVVYEKIIKCDISTSTFQIETLFVESALSDQLLSFSYDKNKEKLILFLSTMSHMNKSKVTYKLKVYDCKQNIIQYDTIITQTTLIGRLKSGRYTFADGHIYYSNNVIKLRYDLIESVNSQIYNEFDIFDNYTNIFDMENKTMKVLANTPLESILSHKLVYIFSDRQFKQPNSILILPYLHENKLHLNRIKPNTCYFVSSIETPISDVNAYNDQIEINQIHQNEGGEQSLLVQAGHSKKNGNGRQTKYSQFHNLKSKDKKRNRKNGVNEDVDFDDSDNQLVDQAAINQNHKDQYGQYQPNQNAEAAPHQDQDNDPVVINEGARNYNNTISTFTSILVVNKTENKFYVYQQNGILANRVNFEKIINQFGNIEAISCNGLNWILKKENSMKLSIFHVSALGMHHIKDINVLKSVRKILKAKEDQSNSRSVNQIKNEPIQKNTYKRKYIWLFRKIEKEKQTRKESFEMQIQINNMFDVCIRLKEVPMTHVVYNSQMGGDSDENVTFEEDIEEINFIKTIYYYEHRTMNLDYKHLEQTQVPQSMLRQLKKNIDKAETQLRKVNEDYILARQENGPEQHDRNTSNIKSKKAQRNKRALNESYFDNIPKFDKILNDHRIKLFETQEQQDIQFTMNTQYLFMWSKKLISYFDIDQHDFKKDNLQEITLRIAEDEFHSSIHEVRVGSQKNLIAIIVSEELDNIYTVFSWDVKGNCEKDANDVKGQYEILWDYQGNFYIIHDNNKVNFVQEQCQIMAYQFQEFSELNENRSLKKLDIGIKFDGKNHNWLIFQEYISLPFSYMTFVIKRTIEQNHSHNTLRFDPVAHYYLFNRCSSFMNLDFQNLNLQYLENILNELDQLNPEFLEILNYSHKYTNEKEDTDKQDNDIDSDSDQQADKMTIKKEMLSFFTMIEPATKFEFENDSPLHRAIRESNTKLVNIFLTYMSKIKNKGTRNFCELFGYLVEYQNFLDYLEYLPVQTHRMQMKQILRIQMPMTDQIVTMNYSSTIYIDKEFYRMKLKEGQQNGDGLKSYPVRLNSFRIDWILDTKSKHGYTFLSNLYKNENLDIYRMKTMQMLIEFLYQKLKTRIILVQAPLYILNFVSFLAMAYFNEQFVNMLEIDSKNQKLEYTQQSNEQMDILNIIIWINLLLMFIQFIQNLDTLRNMRWLYVKRFNSWLDIFIAIVCVIIQLLFNILMQKKPEFTEFKNIMISLREIMVIGILLMFFKCAYFLQLIDIISPLIDIIFRIFQDIVYFLFILSTTVLVFSYSFYLIAQNQLNFDSLTYYDTKTRTINYDSYLGSIWYMVNLLLGNTDTSPFSSGDASQLFVLKTIFFLSAFVIMIHLLNMLIAIMGDTYSKRREQEVSLRQKDHLRFVLDNFHLRENSFKEISSVRYIIAAFQMDEEISESEELFNINEKVQCVQLDILQNNQKNSLRMQTIKEMVLNMIRRQEIGQEEYQKIMKHNSQRL